MKRNFRGVLTRLWKDSWRQRQAQPRTTLIRINHINCHSLEAIFARILGNSSNKNIKYGIAPAVGKKGGGLWSVKRLQFASLYFAYQIFNFIYVH